MKIFRRILAFPLVIIWAPLWVISFTLQIAIDYILGEDIL